MYFSFINFLSFLSVLFFSLFVCVSCQTCFFVFQCGKCFFLSNQGRQGRLIHTHTRFSCVYSKTTSGRSTRQRFKVRIWCQDNGYLGVFYCRLQTKMFCGTVMKWFALTLINLLLSALIERSCPYLKLSRIPKSYPLCCSQIFQRM